MYNAIYGNMYGRRINEAKITDMSSGNTETMLKIGKYPMYVNALRRVVDVDLKVIVNTVNDALAELATEYEFMYQYIKWSRPQYVLADPGLKTTLHKTMAVDEKGNLWMNVHFIYNNLDCDKNKIFGILFHELMHNFLNHIERSNDVMSKEDLDSLYKVSRTLGDNEQLKQNLCMDYEVNCNMVADGVVPATFWKELKGMFDEKYFGKMWEEIYHKDGEQILSDYLALGGSKLPPEYFEIVKEILEAMKILRNPKSTDREKEIAMNKLKDLLMKMFGDPTPDKMTIRKRLQKLQATRIKEIGEIGPYLKEVIDALVVSPRNMGEDEFNNFIESVKKLGNEMIANVEKIDDEFNCGSIDTLERDIETFTDTLITGTTRMHSKKSMDAVEMEEITAEVVYTIDRLLADNKKKKKLAEERKKRLEELKKKRDELMEKFKNRHILKSYTSRLDDLRIINKHERMSDDTSVEIGKLENTVKSLLENPTIEETTDAIRSIGLPKFKELIDAIPDLLYKDLKKLVDEKIIVGKDDEYLRNCCEKFRTDNYNIFKAYDEEKSETEIISKIKIAISSIARIGTLLNTQKKVRPSEPYKKGYKEEYKRLRKIYKELGEKGLRRELGLPEEGEITPDPDPTVKTKRLY